MAKRLIMVLFAMSFGVSCATAQVTHSKENDLGLLWANHAAEYEAIARQVYQVATQALPGFVDDRSWTVVSGNPDYRDLPPAVILDVDETTVSNRAFQISFTPKVGKYTVTARI